jgi:hypothetical protein
VRTRLTIWPLRIEEDRVQTEFSHAQRYAIESRSYFCSFADDEQWSYQKEAEAFESACEWFQAMTEAFEGDYDSVGWRDFLSEHRHNLPDDDHIVESSIARAM